MISRLGTLNNQWLWAVVNRLVGLRLWLCVKRQTVGHTRSHDSHLVFWNQEARVHGHFRRRIDLRLDSTQTQIKHGQMQRVPCLRQIWLQSLMETAVRMNNYVIVKYCHMKYCHIIFKVVLNDIWFIRVHTSLHTSHYAWSGTQNIVIMLGSLEHFTSFKL